MLPPMTRGYHRARGYLCALIVVATACGNDRGLPAVPPASLHRLTAQQYTNTVHLLFGEDVVIPAIEADIKLHGFTSIATGELTITPNALEQYETAARDLARQAVADPERRARVIGCEAPVEPCLGEFFARFGRRAWRRPLTPTELETITTIVAKADALLGGDGWSAVEFGIAAILQAPDFLYRIELGEPEKGTRRKLGAYELASRLAFVITETGPDDALLDAAAAGELDDRDGLRRHAAILLEQPRGRLALARFFSEYLNLERLAETSKDPILFPQMTEQLQAGMRAEIEALFTQIVFDDDADYRQIFTSDQTYVNAELAALYGLEPPTEEEVASGKPARRTLPADSARGGLLGAAGLLALYADSAASSPTRRGRFVRQNLLCEDIPPPPPGVDTSFGENTGTTIRERLAVHRENPTCAGCHALMDPIGLGFERFDAIGQIRTEEAPGVPVDDTGDVDGVPFKGVRELGAMLAVDARVGPCFVTQFYRFATGHLEHLAERPAIDDLAVNFAASGFRVRELVLRLVESDAFRYVGPAIDTSAPAGEEAP